MTILLNLRRDLDPALLTNIQSIINAHIANHNNPHEDNENNVIIDVVAELYTYWQGLGNTGTVGQMTAILFQDDARASLVDILAGTSTALVDVQSASGLISYHNEDPNAHAALMSLYFPGSSPTSSPVFSMMSLIGLPDINVTTPRTAPTTYIGSNGILYTAAAGVIPVDYETGAPEFSCWTTRTNTITNSDPTVNPNITYVGSTPGSDATILAPDRTSNFSVITEDSSLGIHGFTLPVSVASGQEFVSSAFLFPKVSSGYFHISIVEEPTLSAWIDISTGNVVSIGSQNAFAYCRSLPTGWFRLGLQYLADVNGSLTLQVNYTPTIGNDVYQGTHAETFAFCNLMHAQGTGLSPFIYTNGAPGTVDNSPIIIYAPNTVNNDGGMFSLEFFEAPSVNGVSAKLMQDMTGAIAINLNPAAIAAVLQLAPSGTASSSSFTTVTPADYNTSDNRIFAMSYGPTTISLKTNDYPRVNDAAQYNPLVGQINTLQIGPLDGYLSSLIIYPGTDTAQALEFLVGEN
ncbi:unnamed protein product [Sphagnum balticum]